MSKTTIDNGFGRKITVRPSTSDHDAIVVEIESTNGSDNRISGIMFGKDADKFRDAVVNLRRPTLTKVRMSPRRTLCFATCRPMAASRTSRRSRSTRFAHSRAASLI